MPPIKEKKEKRKNDNSIQTITKKEISLPEITSTNSSKFRARIKTWLFQASPSIFSCQRTFQRCRACLPAKIFAEKARKSERQLRLLPSNVIVERFSIFRLATPSCSPSSVPKLARSWFSTSAHVRSCVDILVCEETPLYGKSTSTCACLLPVDFLFRPVLVPLIPYFLAESILEFDSRGEEEEEDWKGKGHLCSHNYIFIIFL